VTLSFILTSTCWWKIKNKNIHVFFIRIASIYKFFLSGCLFICLSVFCIQQTSTRLNRSGPNFVWDLNWPQGRFMNDQNFKNLCLKVFYFCKILKLRKKYYEISKLFFVFLLYCTKRRCSEIKPRLKVEIDGEREAP